MKARKGNCIFMINIEKLSNGITVVLEEMNHLRSASFGIWIKVGSCNENNSNNGISHMIEHMLFKGTTHRSAKDLANDMAMIGGNLNAYTSKECTSFYVTTLDSHLPMAINIIGDMICNSLFTQEDIKKEKGVIIEEIDMYDDSPDDLVHEMLQKKAWKDHPLGFIISGSKKNVNGFTRNEILDYFNKYYTANNIVISIAGSFEKSKTLTQLEEQFGGILSSSESSLLTEPVYHKCFYKQKKDIEQIHMNLAFESVSYNSSQKYALSIINSILGGSENSKLFQIIREEQGLTYSIYSYGSSYNAAGLFHIDAALNPSKLSKVYHEIISVIEQFKIDGVTDEELQRTKEQINTELIIGSESTRNRMNSNGKAMLCRGKIISLDETVNRLNAVSKEDISNFLQHFFVTNQCSVSLVGNTIHKEIVDFENKWKNTTHH